MDEVMQEMSKKQVTSSAAVPAPKRGGGGGARSGWRPPRRLLPCAAGMMALALVAFCAAPAAAFEVTSNKPFAARCNGPLGAVVVRDSDVHTMSVAAAAQEDTAAVQAQHSVAQLQRAAQPIRWLTSRGVMHGPVDVRFPRVVVHTTSSNQLVLPNLVSAMQTGTQIGAPTNQLHVTFQGFDSAVAASYQAYLQVALPVAYRIYGPPAFDLNVKVIEDSTVQDIQGGYYDVTTNEVHMAPPTGNFNEDTFVLMYCLLHAFHDDCMMFFDSWEDGFAGAAATAIQTTPGVAPGYSPYDPGPFYALSVYEAENQPQLGNSTFYPSSGFLGMLVWRIAMARAAWLKCYIEDPKFFADFNAEYYSQYTPSLAGDTPGLKDIAATVLPSVEGMSFYDWYERQYVLDTSVHVGPKMYVWNIPLQQSDALLVESYTTDSSGNETPTGGQAMTVYWSYDFSVSLYAEEGNVISVPATGDSAGEGTLIPTFFNVGDAQRITVQIDLNGLRGYYPYPYNERGFEAGQNNLYGALLDAVDGKISLSGGVTASDISAARGVWGTEVMSGNMTPSQLQVTYTDTSGGQMTRTIDVGWDSYDILMRGGPLTTVTKTFPAGVYLMSLPIYPTTPSATDLLGVPASTLLLARWDPRLNGSGAYKLWPDMPGFTPGAAFWMKLYSAQTVTAKGIVPDPDTDFSVPMQYGWNMIGVPRQTSVALSNLLVQVGTDPAVSFADAVTDHYVAETVFGYTQAGGYQAAETLQPFEGYWVRSLLPSEVRLIFPAASSTTTSAVRQGALPASKTGPLALVDAEGRAATPVRIAGLSPSVESRWPWADGASGRGGAVAR